MLLDVMQRNLWKRWKCLYEKIRGDVAAPEEASDVNNTMAIKIMSSTSLRTDESPYQLNF